jgi:tetratricopeptide (TPR) repeat protein
LTPLRRLNASLLTRIFLEIHPLRADNPLVTLDLLRRFTMKPALHVTLITAISLAFAPAATAQESWVGKTVFIKKSPVKIDVIDQNAKQVRAGELNAIVCEVRGDKDGRLQVHDDRGITGWIDKADVVVLEEAVLYFTKRIDQNNKDSSAYASRAWAWKLKGDLGLALSDADEAVRLDPRADAFFIRGEVWSARGDFDKASAAFTEALRIEPKYAAAYNGRANVWSARQDYDKAIADYSEAIKLDPARSLFHSNRGIAWSDKKDFDKAIADYTEAIKLDPKNRAAYNGRGIAWREKMEHDKAIADHTEAIKLDPKNALNFTCRGLAWTEKKEYDKAIADYTEAIRLDPKYALAHNNRGSLFFMKRDYDKAIRDLNEAIRLNPRYVLAHLKRAEAWEGKDEYDKAIADYTEAIRLDATNFVCMSVFGARLFFCRDAVIAGAALFLGHNEHHQVLVRVDQELPFQTIALARPSQPDRRVGSDDWVVHAPPPWACSSRMPGARTDSTGPKSVHDKLARDRVLSIMRNVEGLLEACLRSPILPLARRKLPKRVRIGQVQVIPGEGAFLAPIGKFMRTFLMPPK